MKKLTALLLVLAMVICQLPVLTLAADMEEPEVLEEPEEVEADAAGWESAELTYINPLYQDVLTEDDLIAHDSSDADAFDDGVLFWDLASAASWMRGQMVKRSEHMHFVVETPLSDSSMVMAAVFGLAVSHTGVPTQGDYLAFQCAGYTGNVRYGRTGTGYEYDFYMTFTYYTNAAQEQAVDTQVQDVLNSLNLSEKTDFEKIKAIYEFICSNTEYDYDNLDNLDYKLQYTAYAALIDHTAVCQGYAVLLYRMALEAGIDCRVITGSGNGGGHAWNILRLGNVYYNADPTWDSQDYNWSQEYINACFLKCDDNFDNHYREYPYDSDEFYEMYPMGTKDYAWLTQIAIASKPDKLVYYVGEELDTTGLTLKLTYSDKTTETVSTGFTVSGFDSTSTGTKTVTVTYQGKTAAFAVTVQGYATSGTCGEKLEWSFADGVLTVTGSGPMTYWAKAANVPWMPLMNQITSIVLPEGLTSIGSYAFWHCTGLTEKLVIPAAVTAVGANAFEGCTGLTEMEFLGDCPGFGISVFEDDTIQLTTHCETRYWNGLVISSLGGTVTVTTVHKNAEPVHIQVGLKPTQTAAGYLEETCGDCAEPSRIPVPKLTDADYTVNVQEPTCAEAGLCQYTWKVTTYGPITFEEVLPKLSHEIQDGKCIHCGMTLLYGDVDGDGRITTLDRATLTRYLAGWKDYPASTVDMLAADVNCDGSVNTLDRIIISRHLANWTGYESLPYLEAIQ